MPAQARKSMGGGCELLQYDSSICTIVPRFYVEMGIHDTFVVTDSSLGNTKKNCTSPYAKVNFHLKSSLTAALIFQYQKRSSQKS